MSDRERDDGGKFAVKGDGIRAVRSIRLTDSTWESLGEKANEHDMTRADFLEGLVGGEVDWESDDDTEKTDYDFDPDEVAEVLKDALLLKANAGGKIKAEIRKVLQIMGYDPDEE
jgi:hypothetical protein